MYLYLNLWGKYSVIIIIKFVPISLMMFLGWFVPVSWYWDDITCGYRMKWDSFPVGWDIYLCGWDINCVFDDSVYDIMR